MGADRAIEVSTDLTLASLHIAKILKVIAQQTSPGLILLGKQAIDNDNNQTGQMLAALLDWPQGTFASKVDMHEGRVLVSREIDGGLETLALSLPAVITADLRLNTPRFISLPNIMLAKRKVITTVPLEDLQLTFKKHLEVISVKAPKKRHAGARVASMKELVHNLKHVAKVLP